MYMFIDHLCDCLRLIKIGVSQRNGVTGFKEKEIHEQWSTGPGFLNGLPSCHGTYLRNNGAWER